MYIPPRNFHDYLEQLHAYGHFKAAAAQLDIAISTNRKTRAENLLTVIANCRKIISPVLRKNTINKELKESENQARAILRE